MQLSSIQGLIRRRLLVNYRVDADVVQGMLPPCFRPKLHAGYAIAGICLIRLEQIRPAWLPSFCSIASENAAHRIAVRWGQDKEGVFIPRRDTGSWLNHLAGGRVFPGEHHRALFTVSDVDGQVSVKAHSTDGGMALAVRGHDGEEWPADSCFASLAESSAFFEPGSIGYSVKRDPTRWDGIRLETKSWHVSPLIVDHVESSFFADESAFPAGSVVFDHALIMRDVSHEWHEEPEMRL